MIENMLQDLGFTQNETKIYFAILDLGESKSGEIIKKANITTGRIYDILTNLIKKGLISYILKSNVKYFHATDPRKILDYIENKQIRLNEQKLELNKILPKLIERKELTKKTYKTEVYQGVKGIKSAIEMASRKHNKDNIFYIMGTPKIENENLQLYFTQWNNVRVAKGATLKIIYNEEAIEKAKERKKLPFTQVKIMKKGIMTPAWMCIIEDNVLIVTLKGDISCIVIKNEEVAKSYLEFFNMIWEMSKKVK